MDDTQAVAVIGSGLVGCLVAKGLAERGFRVNLYDGRMDPADHDYEASCAIRPRVT
jgi:2-polyprenyl-6-methoxyphenol hydroxylase-like FAD-dependent oxidoreductase